MQKTTNYQLNKPETSDPIRVADFNQNSDIIDAALKSLNTAVSTKAEQSALTALTAAATKIAVGSYVGTGTSDRDNPNILTFDFAPQALFVWGPNDHAQGIRGQQLYAHLDGTSHRCTTTWNGNTAQWHAGYPAYQMNSNGETYCYLAIG